MTKNDLLLSPHYPRTIERRMKLVALPVFSIDCMCLRCIYIWVNRRDRQKYRRLPLGKEEVMVLINAGSGTGYYNGKFGKSLSGDGI